MKRRNQILAGLLGAQIILIVLIFLPRVLPAQNQSGPLLGSLQTSDVVKMMITDDKGSALILVKQAAGWTLPQFEDYAANGNQVTQLIDKLTGIKTDVLATDTASSLPRMQVADDNFVRKIDLQGGDGVTHTLYLGTASGGGANHVRLAGQDNVYVARGINSYEAATDVSSWINPTYLTVPQANLLSASIENAQGKFEFSNNANVWTMKDLASGEQFNQDALITMLARLGSLTMMSPLGKEAKPEYGLDKPSATVTVVVSNTNSTKVYTLKVGTKDSGGNYPVISSDSTWYVKVVPANVEPFINAKLDTFLVQPTPTPVVTQQPTPEATPTIAATESLTPAATITTTEVLTPTATLTATEVLTPTATPKP
jgi:hypothetical protein